VEKLSSVQYLRACAALLVLVTHSFSYQVGDHAPFVGLTGHLGVMLFFVISGFIMVYISGEAPFSALTFLKRRAIRIVPLYWLFTIFAALLAALLPNLFQRTIFTWPHFLESLLFIVHEAPKTGSLSPLLSLGWTLNYEVYFYIAFAMVAFLHVGPRVILLSILFIGAWLVGLLAPPTNPVLQFYLHPAPLAFAAGTWIGWLFLNGEVTSTSAEFWHLAWSPPGASPLRLPTVARWGLLVRSCGLPAFLCLAFCWSRNSASGTCSRNSATHPIPFTCHIYSSSARWFIWPSVPLAPTPQWL